MSAAGAKLRHAQVALAVAGAAWRLVIVVDANVIGTVERGIEHGPLFGDDVGEQPLHQVFALDGAKAGASGVDGHLQRVPKFVGGTEAVLSVLPQGLEGDGGESGITLAVDQVW
jgi:hypothetical protein